MALSDLLFLAYALLGPGLAGTLVLLAHLGRRHMVRLLDDPAPPLPDPAPTLAIAVPVRNEAHAIGGHLRRLLAQDYPPDRLRVVVIDDRSDDGTPAELAAVAREAGGRLVVERVEALPAGWLGKPHALHVARERHLGGSQWLLFVDSDVELDASSARRLVALATGRGYDAASLLTGLAAPTWLEAAVGPAAAAAWLTAFRGSETNNDSRAASAVANGQVLLVRRAALDAAGGHAAARDQTCEDVFLFRAMKASGRRVRLLIGTHLARTRMHADFAAMLNGWARNFAGTARHRPGKLVVAACVLLLQLAWPVALAYGLAAGDWPWAVLGTAHAAAVGAWFWWAAWWATGSRRRAAVAAASHPAALPMLALLLLNGVRACLGGRVTWRGSRVRA